MRASHALRTIAPLFSIFTGCGYQLGAAAPGGVRVLAVELRDQYAVDVDAPALVSDAVRRAIARGPGTELAGGSGAEATLEVSLVSAQSSLEPFADPATRAGSYRAVVNVTGRLIAEDGRELWRSSLISGAAPYLSTPGPLEGLEGNRRRALQRAADDAADRLVASMIFGH